MNLIIKLLTTKADWLLRHDVAIAREITSRIFTINLH